MKHWNIRGTERCKGKKAGNVPEPLRTACPTANDMYACSPAHPAYFRDAVQGDGFNQGIFVDADGFVCEGPNMNLGILTRDNVLVVGFGQLKRARVPAGLHVCCTAKADTNFGV